jgi:hypothetical protein
VRITLTMPVHVSTQRLGLGKLHRTKPAFVRLRNILLCSLMMIKLLSLPLFCAKPDGTQQSNSSILLLLLLQFFFLHH